MCWFYRGARFIVGSIPLFREAAVMIWIRVPRIINLHHSSNHQHLSVDYRCYERWLFPHPAGLIWLDPQQTSGLLCLSQIGDVHWEQQPVDQYHGIYSRVNVYIDLETYGESRAEHDLHMEAFPHLCWFTGGYISGKIKTLPKLKRSPLWGGFPNPNHHLAWLLFWLL